MSMLFFVLFAASPAALPADLRTPCSAAETAQVSVAEIIDAGETWFGRCVQVSGVTAGRLLKPAAGSLLQIGLDNSEALNVGLPANEDVRVTLIGRVDSCDRRQREVQAEMARTRDIILLSGACHYVRGPILVASEGRSGD